MRPKQIIWLSNIYLEGHRAVGCCLIRHVFVSTIFPKTQSLRHQWHQWKLECTWYMLTLGLIIHAIWLLWFSKINSSLPGRNHLFTLQGIVGFHVIHQTQWVLNRTNNSLSNSPMWFQLGITSFNWDQWKLLHLPIICLILHARIPEQLLHWPAIVAFHLLFYRAGVASLSPWWMENQNYAALHPV